MELNSLQPVVVADGLGKRFGDVIAVDCISFQVRPGETVALLGGNGAGKTTTMAMLLGLLTPSSGQVRIFDADMVHDRHKALARMNFSSPYVDLPRRLTPRENLTVYGHLYGVRGVAARVDILVQDMDMGAFVDRPMSTLSAGQDTRVALAKALINSPEVLLLDEPTASLDPETGDRIRGYLEGYRAETQAAIVLASHNMVEVERICDRVLMLRHGKVVDSGSPSALISKYGRENLEEVFLHIARDGEVMDA